MIAGAMLLGAGPPAAPASPVAVDLGEAARFAVLAGSGISDTGPSVISGDVGTHPLPAIPDLIDREAAGIVDRAGPKSKLAQRDLASAFASVAALQPIGTISLADDRNLAAGAYAIADDKQAFTANLILDGQNAPHAVWIFVVAKDLVTASGGTIALVNGAQACNVFWLVGGSAKLASGSTFVGSILARTSVEVGSGVTIAGRLLARTAGVSLGGDRITVPVCSALGTVTSAIQPAAATALPVSYGAPAAGSRPQHAMSGYLPIALVLIVAAAILGEPRHRRRRR